MHSGAFVVLAALAVFGICEAGDCSAKFKQDDKHANVSESCVKKLNIKPDEMPKSEEEFVKTFDDKCFGKCFMSKMGFLVNNTLDRDAIKTDIHEHVLDAELQKKILAYTVKCLDESDEFLKSEGGKITDANECKVAAHFLYCTMKKENELEC